MRFDDVPDDREAQAEAANGRRGVRFATAERLEDMRQKIGRDPRACVADDDLDVGRTYRRP
jgi:hypothetical protein